MTNSGPDDETVRLDAILDGQVVEPGQQVTRIDATKVQPAATVLRPTRATQPIKRRGPSRGARVTIVCFCIVALAACAVLVYWRWYLPRHQHSAASQPGSSASQTQRGTVTSESPSASASASPSPTPTKAPVSATASPPAQLPPGLRGLQAGINSSDRAAQAQVLIPAERASFTHGPALLPPGDRLTIDPGTLKLVNNNEHIATVMATDSHGQKYQLGLYRKSPADPWQLALSKKVS